VLAPAKTPKAIVDRRDKTFAAVLANDDIKTKFVDMGAEVDYLSQGELFRFLAAESEKWTKVAKQAGIQTQWRPRLVAGSKRAVERSSPLGARYDGGSCITNRNTSSSMRSKTGAK
jgi:hypothetical protein